VQRFIKLINTEISGLHQAAFLLAFASLGAKVLAIFRDRILASSFGAGETLDIYYASFRLPDLLYVFSLFLVSVTALIPLILEKREGFDSKHFINEVFTVFFAVMLFLLVVSFFILPYIADIIAPGFSLANKEILIKFSRIMLLSPFLLGLSNLVSSVIQSFRRFFVYSLSGILYNAGIIIGLVFLYPKFGLSGIVWGVVLGAFLHFLVQVPSLMELGYLPRFTFKIHFSEIVNVVRLSFPRTLGLILNQVVLMAMTSLASFLFAGSITIFNLASNLQSIPSGIIALSYSTAAFPALASNFLKKEKKEFLFSVVSSFRHILFWLLPITALFIVLRAQIVRVALGAGAFNWTDTRLTAAAVALFAFSLFAQGLVLLLVRAFYAVGKTKPPLIINIISSFFTILLAAGFLVCFKYFPCAQAFLGRILRVEGVAGISVLLLPLAYSMGSILNFFLLFLFFEKNFGPILHYFKKSLIQIISVSVLAGTIAYFSLVVFAQFFNLSTFVGIFTQGFLAGIFALAGCFFLLKFLKNKEFEEIVFSLKKRFVKKPLLDIQPEKLP